MRNRKVVLLLSTFFKRGTRRDNWYSKIFPCNAPVSPPENGGATNGVGTGLLLPMLSGALSREIIFIENC